MSEKSPDAFRTISEVADDLDLPQHVLRFWETRFAQIKPLKRGGGRRYYRPSDVDLLRGIRHLLYEEGYTIKGVQRILRENGAQLAQSIGAGDLSALQELARRKAQANEPAQKARKTEPAVATPKTVAPKATAAKAEARSDDGAGENDIMVGHARPRGRGIFGLGGGVGEEVGDLSRDNRTLLQEALFDLLECKRLLDQTR